LIDTIKGFKGLESDAVVITDIPEINTTASFALEDAYVGFSRAKHELVAISLDDSSTAMLLRWMKQ
jgi:DNA helicase IV